MTRTLTAISLLVAAAFVAPSEARACSNIVPVELIDNQGVVEDIWQGQSRTSYEIQVPEPGFVAVKAVPLDYAGAQVDFGYSGPAGPGCPGDSSSSEMLYSYQDATEALVYVHVPGTYYFPIYTRGRRRALDGRFEVRVAFSPEMHHPVPSGVSLSDAQFDEGTATLDPVIGDRLEQHVFFMLPGYQEDSRALEIPVFGAGLLAVKTEPDFRLTINSSQTLFPLYLDQNDWSAVVLDSTLGHRKLTISLEPGWRDGEQQTEFRFKWIPLCGISTQLHEQTLGCPLRGLPREIPFHETLELQYGGALVVPFTVSEAGMGPIRVTTAHSDFDPIISVYLLQDATKVGGDQDDGPDFESMWTGPLPPGEYAVRVVDSSGFGFGDTRLRIDQDPSFAGLPSEYPEPEGDMLPSTCLGSNAPLLQPGDAVAGAFQNTSDIDVVRISPPESGRQMVLQVMGVARGEFRHLLSGGPALVIAEQMGYPRGIVRQNETETGCLVLTPWNGNLGPYTILYEEIEPEEATTSSESSSFSLTETHYSSAMEAECTVPSRGLLSPSIRENSTCRQAWKAYLGTKLATAQLVAQKSIMLEELESFSSMTRASGELLKGVLDTALAAHSFGLGNTEQRVLIASYFIPTTVLQLVAPEGGENYLVSWTASCIADTLASLPAPTPILAVACTSDLFVDSYTMLVIGLETGRRVKELEGEIVKFLFLREWFSLGTISAVASKYGASNGDLLEAIALEEGYLQPRFFETSSSRAAKFDELYEQATSFVLDLVEPTIDEHCPHC